MKEKKKKDKAIERGMRDVNTINAAIAEASALLKTQDAGMISKAIRNSKTPLEKTIKEILKKNKGKTAEDIIEILASKTRKGKAGEALVAASFNLNAFKKGKLNPHGKQPGDVFAIVNPKANETGRDVLIFKVGKNRKNIEIKAQEVKTGTRAYALNQSRNGKYKDVVTNKENVIVGKPNGTLKKSVKIEGVKSRAYSEKQAVRKTKKILKRQLDGKPAVTALDEAKIISTEVVKGGAKSAVTAAGISAIFELGSDWKNGKKIDKKRLKEVGKNSAKAGVNAAVNTATKVVTIKAVEKTIISKAGQTVAKKIIGKTATKVVQKNVGKIAGPAGGFILDSVVSVKDCIQGNQSINKTAVDVGLNAVNATLYVTCPPAAITLTVTRIAWDVCGFKSLTLQSLPDPAAS